MFGPQPGTVWGGGRKELEEVDHRGCTFEGSTWSMDRFYLLFPELDSLCHVPSYCDVLTLRP